MTLQRSPVRRPHAAHLFSAALWLASWGVLSVALPRAAAADAIELTPALPQTFHLGRPAGATPMRGGDWGRTRHAELPAPAQATVLWQRTLPGGISANLLVDASGRVFVAGFGRVQQLGPDGRDQYVRHAEFTSAVASALLADGQRVVLGREGVLWSWSAQGVPGFALDLRASPGWARGDLLPLPEGGALASLGAWLFQVSARGELEAYARLKEPAAETLISEGQTWIVSESGNVLRWDGQSPPSSLGDVGGHVSAAAVRAPGRLLALVEGRELVDWSGGARQRTGLASLDGAGNAARLSVANAELVFVLGTNGVLSSVQSLAATESPSESRPESQRLPPGPGELVSSSDGTVAWFVANAPLTLQRAGMERHSLPEVVCAQPSSLAPLGDGRLLAACRSGQLWLVGPAASRAPTTGEGARP